MSFADVEDLVLCLSDFLFFSRVLSSLFTEEDQCIWGLLLSAGIRAYNAQGRL